MYFEKLHGCRNDFVFTEWQELSAHVSLSFLRELANRILDRKSGIGADTWVIWKASEHYKLHPKVEVLLFNPDGSLAANCGNAMRCLGLTLLRKGLWNGNTTINVQRLVPPYELNLSADEHFATQPEVFAKILYGHAPNKVQGTFAISMQKEAQVFRQKQDMHTHVLIADFYNWAKYTGVFVQLANPHWVFISRDFLNFNQEQFIQFGQYHQTSAKPANIPVANIGMLAPLQPENNRWKLVVYERGAGLTEACGTGATAARVALEFLELIPSEAPDTEFILPGGSLKVSSINTQTNERTLSGQAAFVFDGYLH